MRFSKKRVHFRAKFAHFIMMIIAVFALLAVASAYEVDKPEVTCPAKHDMVVLLDPTVKPEVFMMLKRASLEAMLAMDMSESQLAIYQMTKPEPKMELSLGSTNKEDLVQTVQEMKPADSESLHGAAGVAMKVAMDALKDSKSDSKVILYVAGNRCGEQLLKTAEEAKRSGMKLRAIAHGMDEAATQELITMTGSAMNVFQFPADDTKMTDSKAKDLAKWFCEHTKN